MANLFANQIKNPDEFYNFYMDICIHQKTVRLVGGFMCDPQEFYNFYMDVSIKGEKVRLTGGFISDFVSVNKMARALFRQKAGSLGPAIELREKALTISLPPMRWPVEASIYPLLARHVAVDVEKHELLIGLGLDKANTGVVFGMLSGFCEDEFELVVSKMQAGATAKITSYGVL